MPPETEAVTHRARKIKERFKKMEQKKQNWLALYQLCGEYVMSRKQAFTEKRSEGTIQTDQMFDDTAPNANSLLAAALIGAMWPNGAKSFRIGMPIGMEDEIGMETEEVKSYYQWVTKRMTEFIDNPKSGFITSLEEYMLDQGAFGISGIMVEDQEDDYEVPLVYRAVDAKALFIEEGKNGFVDTIYIKMEYTIRQLVAIYGFDNISKKWRDLYTAGKECDEKVAVLHAIEPRMERDPYGFGTANMPYASIHIDLETDKILKESGFLELPIAVTRFWKAMGEVYGRCPSMQALPSILEANAIGEAWILAIEKTLDPPLAVIDDSIMGNGVIDTSPGALNVVSVSGRIGAGKPIEPLFLVGDLQWTAARRTELTEIIGRHYFQDRLTGLGKDERMQNPEVHIVNDLRGQSLNTTYSRQFGEMFVPTIETSFNKLWRRGFLGVEAGSDLEAEMLSKGIVPRQIPDAVIQWVNSGRKAHRIEFISPATRIMQAAELEGIERYINTTIMTAPVVPNVTDNPDWDFLWNRLQELYGAPDESVLSMERIRKIREDRAQMQQAMAELEMMRGQSEAARNMGQATAQMGSQKGAA